MAIFVIERGFAEAIDLSDEDVREINLINGEEDVRSILSPTERRRQSCRRPRRKTWT